MPGARLVGHHARGGSSGTRGKTVDGRGDTVSLPMPRLTGVLVARLHITSGALSMRLRPFHDANPNTADVPTVYGNTFGNKRSATAWAYAVGSLAVPVAATAAATADMTVSAKVSMSVAGDPPLRRSLRSSLNGVNSGWSIGRPARLMLRHPPASVASVDWAHTPMRCW